MGRSSRTCVPGIASILILALAGIAPAADSQPQLVKDIRAGAAGSGLKELSPFGGGIVFWADDGIHGSELWTSDGTAAGTALVLDVNPGKYGIGSLSGKNELVVAGGLVLFVGWDPIHGQELWASYGTAAGTAMVKDISPGTSFSYVKWPTEFAGTVYFRAVEPSSGAELWKSDGTAAGTVLVKDINSGTAHSSPMGFTPYDGAVYFGATDGTSGRELWRTDGTAAGTVMVKDIHPGSMSSGPHQFKVFDGKLYFIANGDGVNGPELWVTDGTPAGTSLLVDLTNLMGTPWGLTPSGGKLFFAPMNADLRVTDGTAAGTKVILSLGSGASSGLMNLIDVDGTLFFVGGDATTGLELWKSDGTAAGTVMVKEITPGATGTYFGGLDTFVAVGSQLYFAAIDPLLGYELWRSDGTAAGTAVVKDLHPLGNSGLTGVTYASGRLYFSASDGIVGHELWALEIPVESVLKEIRNDLEALALLLTDPSIAKHVKAAAEDIGNALAKLAKARAKLASSPPDIRRALRSRQRALRDLVRAIRDLEKAKNAGLTKETYEKLAKQICDAARKAAEDGIALAVTGKAKLIAKAKADLAAGDVHLALDQFKDAIKDYWRAAKNAAKAGKGL